MQRQPLERPVGYLLFALVVAIYFVVGYRGMDYGPHEDEWYARDATRAAVNELTFFPERYVYNHLYFAPSLLCVAYHERAFVPEAIAQIFDDPQPPFEAARYPAVLSMQEDARAYIDSDRFLLDTRKVFFDLSALALLAVFLTVLSIRPRAYLMAAAGAACLGLSFQFVSHARFVAVDTLLTTLWALEIYVLSRLLRGNTRLSSLLHLGFAAVLAGLAIGCKMTGVTTLVPLWIAPFVLRLTWPSAIERIALAVGATILAVIVFFVTTPGAFLQPFHFLFGQAELQHGYASQDHPHSVPGILEHAKLIAVFVGASFPSPKLPFAIAMSGLALIGARVLHRTRRSLFLVALAFALSLVGLLVPRSLFFARNYLPLAPLFAIALAFGLGHAGAWLPRFDRRVAGHSPWLTARGYRRAALPLILAALSVTGFVVNAVDLFEASHSIQTDTREQILADTRDYLIAERAPFRISPRLRDALGPELDAHFVCRRGPLDPEPDAVAMFYADHDAASWLSNRVGFVTRTFGSREVDYDWYATWAGRHAPHRAVVLSSANAYEMGVPIRRFLGCRVRRGADDDEGCGARPEGVITLEDLLVSMRDLDAHVVRDETVESVRLASSFDHHSRGTDPSDEGWFANRDRDEYVRIDGDEKVMIDVRGPGVLTRFGSANPSGHLRVYVDGEIVLEGPMREVLAAEGLPVGDDLSFVAARGHNLYLPIPYQESLRVTTDTRDGLYYQLTYRTYVPGTRIESFSREVVERAMCNTESRVRPGVVEPLPIANDGDVPSSAPGVLRRVLDTGISESASLSAPPGGARIRELIVDGRGLTAEQLRGTELTLAFDGETTVRTPLGDFFHGGPGLRPFESQWVSVREDGAMIARWPMPFARTATITLRARNASPAPIAVTLHTEPVEVTPETLRFYAHWRPPTAVRVTNENRSPIASDFRVAEVHGRGLYVGLILDAANPDGSWWGEGDEKIVIDGEDFPSHFGTGTEDYFGWAWCSTLQFAKDFVGQIRSNLAHNGGYLSAYRWLALDAIPFDESLTFDMEVYHWISRGPDLYNDFDAIAFFYLAPGARFEGPEITDADFRIPDMPEEFARPAPPGHPPYGCGQGMPP